MSTPPESITRDWINRDVVGKSLPVDAEHNYTVHPEDVRSIEASTVDGHRGWMVTIVGPRPYVWFVYYTTTGELFKVQMQS